MVMVSTTTTVGGSVVKVSGAGVVVVVAAARTNVATVRMTAGWNRISTSSATSAEIIRPRVRLVIVNGRGG